MNVKASNKELLRRAIGEAIRTDKSFCCVLDDMKIPYKKPINYVTDEISSITDVLGYEVIWDYRGKHKGVEGIMRVISCKPKENKPVEVKPKEELKTLERNCLNCAYTPIFINNSYCEPCCSCFSKSMWKRKEVKQKDKEEAVPKEELKTLEADTLKAWIDETNNNQNGFGITLIHNKIKHTLKQVSDNFFIVVLIDYGVEIFYTYEKGGMKVIFWRDVASEKPNHINKIFKEIRERNIRIYGVMPKHKEEAKPIEKTCFNCVYCFSFGDDNPCFSCNNEPCLSCNRQLSKWKSKEVKEEAKPKEKVVWREAGNISYQDVVKEEAKPETKPKIDYINIGHYQICEITLKGRHYFGLAVCNLGEDKWDMQKGKDIVYLRAVESVGSKSTLDGNPDLKKNLRKLRKVNIKRGKRLLNYNKKSEETK